MGTQDSFEAALEAAEERADTALKAAAAVTRELKKARAAAATGQARDLRRSLQAAEAAAAQVAEAATAACAGFDFDEQAHMASGAYVKELLATAAESGLAMFEEEDDRLLCYPSLVRVLASESAVEVDKKRERRLRPTVLVAHLKDRQSRPLRSKPEPFLEALLAAYELVVAANDKKRDAVVRLVDVWAVLTLLPGQSRDYTRQEFARDLYLLDHEGVAGTKSGRTLRWSASTGTKGPGTLTTVAKSGQQQRYWGISFS